MEIIDYLLARKKAGGGSDVTIEQLTATENGTYSEEGKAYSPVVVNVPTPANSYQLTDIPAGTVSTIEDGTDLPMSSLKVGIEPVQSGSGDPSPDNIRPISGWDECNVTRTGKNLFDESILLECDGWTVSNGIYSGLSGQLFNKYGNGIPNLVFKQNTRYTFSFTYSQEGLAGNGFAFIIRYTDNTVSAKYCTLETIGSIHITSTAGKSIKRIELSYGSGRIIYLSNIQFEEGSTATTYEPYNGQTYTIEFRDGDNPLTVYGGTLDVVSGELVVDRASVDLGTLDWSTASTGRHIVGKPTDIKIVPNVTAMNGVCSQYILVSGNASATTDNSICMLNSSLLQINDSNLNGTDAGSFKAAMSGVQLVYELAEPITYSLTPTQIRTLVGNNNIWADTGDIIEGKYFKSLT